MTLLSATTLEGATSTAVTADEANATAPLPPTERYVVGEEIARGGVGRILRAYDRKLDRPVAIKELLSGGAAEARFTVEALVTARLEHPSIIPVHDTGRFPGGSSYYTMKLVEGRSLAAAMAEHDTMSARLTLLPHLIDVAEALAYAHSRGVVHRDLKPHNVLIGSFGETVVIDWGLAKLLTAPVESAGAESAGAGAASDDRAAASLTLAGSVLGTPEYMAPEQALGQPADLRFDVYALGAMLYQLITGMPPVERTPGSVREQVLAGPKRDILELEPSAPKDLVAISEKAMARDPSERYADAGELVRELRRYRDGLRVAAYAYSAREIMWRWLRRRRLVVSAAAVAMLSIVVALLVVSIDRAALADALTVAERREADAEAREANARGRETAAIERADLLRIDQARLEAKADPARALDLLAGLSEGFDAFNAARVIAADALAHPEPRILAHLEGERFELVIADDGSALAWARTDGELRILHADGRSETVGHLPKEGTAVGLSPDGRVLAAGAGDGSVRLIDVASRRVQDLEGHTAPVQQVLFSPDGRMLATSSTEPRVHLHDRVAGTTRTLTGADTMRYGMAFSPDGKALATTGDHGAVVVHDLEGDAPAKSHALDGFEPTYVSFSPDGGAILVEDPFGRAELLDLADSSFRTVARTRADASFSADGKLIALGYDDGVIDILHAADSSLLRRLTCGPLTWSAKFTRDGRHLVVASRDALCVFSVGTWARRLLVGHAGGILYAYTAPSGAAVATVDGHGRLLLHELSRLSTSVAFAVGEPVRDVAFSPDSQILVAAAADAVARLEVGSGKTQELAHLARAHRVEFSPDGTRLVAIGSEPMLLAFDRPDRDARPIAIEAQALDLAFTLDGERIALAGRDGGVRMVNVGDETVEVLARHDDVARGLAFSHDGGTLASVGFDLKLRLIDIEHRSERVLETQGRLNYTVGFSADDRLVAVTGDEGACIWDVASGRRQTCQTAVGRVAPTFTEGGEALVVASAIGALFLPTSLDERAREAPRELGGHRDLVRASLSPDGGRLVTGDFDGVVRLWDVASGEERRLIPHGGMITALSFSPDGWLVASGGFDGTVWVHRDDLPLAEVAVRARIRELATENGM